MKNLTTFDLITYLDQLANPELAENWDNVGLQIGSYDQNISGILTALDATLAVIQEAIDQNLNTIVCHHPLYFKEIKNISDSHLVGRKSLLAIKNNIQIISLHTNLDASLLGINSELCRRLEIKNTQPLLTHAKHPQEGLGRIGEFSQTISIENLLKLLKNKLNIKNVRIAGSTKHNISKIALCSGSGASFWQEARSQGADCFITGDLKYHDALDITENVIESKNTSPFCVIDIGHFGSEIIVRELLIRELKRELKKEFSAIPIQSSSCEFEPWVTRLI